MIASRFLSVLLVLAVAATVAALQLSLGAFGRLRQQAFEDGLSADSRVVSWYLRDDARDRAAELIRFAASPAIAKGLASSLAGPAAAAKARAAVSKALAEIAKNVPEERAFDALFAVNRAGKVVARVGFPQANRVAELELGGYAVVADALHGHVRDDALGLGKLYRVVARPVELRSGADPVGAIVGGRRVDERFAQQVADQTGAAVAFYFDGRRVGTGAPPGFEKSGAELIVPVLGSLPANADYARAGRTRVRPLGPELAGVFSAIPGEARQMGAGFAVLREQPPLGTLAGLLGRADQKDRESIQWPILGGAALLVMVIALWLSWVEHSRPLARLLTDATALAQGYAEKVSAAQHRGAIRKVVLQLNEALERARGSGQPSGTSVDLGKVLEGDSPPAMTAYRVPDASADGAPVSPPAVSPPAPISPPAASPPAPISPPAASPPAPVSPPAVSPPAASPPARRTGDAWGSPGRGEAVPPPTRRPLAAADLPVNGPVDIEPAWHGVYEEFVAIKRACGESVDGFTFERFSATLRKNRDALIQQHGVEQVHFAAYQKEGKAALRAKPVRA